MSQITTHVLDTSLGKPASGIAITLEHKTESGWKKISAGITNADGRTAELLPAGKIMDVGTYRFVFETGVYFRKQNVKTFYPQVVIEFKISDASHYHVPLLLSPFGYSTYRGS